MNSGWPTRDRCCCQVYLADSYCLSMGCICFALRNPEISLFFSRLPGICISCSFNAYSIMKLSSTFCGEVFWVGRRCYFCSIFPPRWHSEPGRDQERKPPSPVLFLLAPLPFMSEGEQNSRPKICSLAYWLVWAEFFLRRGVQTLEKLRHLRRRYPSSTYPLGCKCHICIYKGNLSVLGCLLLQTRKRRRTPPLKKLLSRRKVRI